MFNCKKIKFLLISLLIVFSISCGNVLYAIGLGDITVYSGYNQPLVAEIPILSMDEIPLDKISVKVTQHGSYSVDHMRYSDFLKHIKVDLHKSANDQVIARLTTKQAVIEPYLQMKVNLTWADDTVSRDYTVILNFTSVNAQYDLYVQRRLNKLLKSAIKTAKPNSGLKHDIENVTISKHSYGPITANENIWDIAKKLRPNNSVTIEQTLIAIIMENPQAFIGRNLNNLQPGILIRVPSLGQIKAIPKFSSAQPRSIAPKMISLAPGSEVNYEAHKPAELTNGEQSLHDALSVLRQKLSQKSAKLTILEKNQVDLQHLLVRKNEAFNQLQSKVNTLEDKNAKLTQLLNNKPSKIKSIQNNIRWLWWLGSCLLFVFAVWVLVKFARSRSYQANGIQYADDRDDTKKEQ